MNGNEVSTYKILWNTAKVRLTGNFMELVKILEMKKVYNNELSILLKKLEKEQ